MEHNTLAEEFKEATGLDLYNHTNEEWNDWFYGQLKEAAKTDTYMREMVEYIDYILDKGGVSSLFRILENYDKLMKKEYPGFDKEYPFWSQCCCALARPTAREEEVLSNDKRNNRDLRDSPTGHTN